MGVLACGTCQVADTIFSLVCRSIFDDPVVSVRDPNLVTSMVPSSAPLPQQLSKATATGFPGGGRDSMVPEVPMLKRPRLG